MSNDPIKEELSMQEVENKLDQILDGRMFFKLSDRIFVIRESSETEKFEANMLSSKHITQLKKRSDVDLYDRALVPLKVKARCKEIGVKYANVNKRSDLMTKLFEYARSEADRNPDIASFDLMSVEGIRWYNKLRKECFTDDEMELLEEIEAIESMVEEMKIHTYEHYGDRAKSFYLMACTLEEYKDGDYHKVFRYAEEETKFGVLPVVKIRDGVEGLTETDVVLAIEKYKAFERGIEPNFLLKLLGTQNGGDSSGTQVKSVESDHLEEIPQDGQEINSD